VLGLHLCVSAAIIQPVALTAYRCSRLHAEVGIQVGALTPRSLRQAAAGAGRTNNAVSMPITQTAMT
jgi:hypothetical protein